MGNNKELQERVDQYCDTLKKFTSATVEIQDIDVKLRELKNQSDVQQIESGVKGYFLLIVPAIALGALFYGGLFLLYSISQKQAMDSFSLLMSVIFLAIGVVFGILSLKIFSKKIKTNHRNAKNAQAYAKTAQKELEQRKISLRQQKREALSNLDRTLFSDNFIPAYDCKDVWIIWQALDNVKESFVDHEYANAAELRAYADTRYNGIKAGESLKKLGYGKTKEEKLKEQLDDALWELKKENDALDKISREIENLKK